MGFDPDTMGIEDQCIPGNSGSLNVLGFRLKMDEYPVNYPEYFRVVDLRQGKKVDDGYRAIHLYYQRDNLAYPIEIQLWCGADYYFNVWSHQHLYKYKDPELGKLLYKEYQSGQIKSETDFLARMEAMERNG